MRSIHFLHHCIAALECPCMQHRCKNILYGSPLEHSPYDRGVGLRAFQSQSQCDFIITLHIWHCQLSGTFLLRDHFS